MTEGVLRDNEIFGDKYLVIGDGEICGVSPKRFGKFGNNVIQIAHAIYFAKKYNLKWVHLKDFGDIDFGYLLKPGFYRLDNELDLYIDLEPPAGEAAISGWFFLLLAQPAPCSMRQLKILCSTFVC